MTTIWQLRAGGDRERNYSSYMIKFGIAMVGQGGWGNYKENPSVYAKGTEAYGDFVRPFCSEVQVGDLIVLTEKHEGGLCVSAIGYISGEYEHNQSLADVEGWDLQHMHRVDWYRPSRPVPVPHLAPRGTFQRVGNQAAREAVLALWDSRTSLDHKDPAPLPPPGRLLTDEELIAAIPAPSPAVATELVARMNWYLEHAKDAREHELRTFLVCPLLEALSWTYDRIRIEHDYLDITLWSDSWNKRDGAGSAAPEVIIETKRIHAGLGAGSLRQVTRYADRNPGCTRLVVTDGFRYKTYTRGSDSQWIPHAYTNFARPLSSNPLDVELGGLAAVIDDLSP